MAEPGSCIRGPQVCVWKVAAASASTPGLGGRILHRDGGIVSKHLDMKQCCLKSNSSKFQGGWGSEPNRYEEASTSGEEGRPQHEHDYDTPCPYSPIIHSESLRLYALHQDLGSDYKRGSASRLAMRQREAAPFTPLESRSPNSRGTIGSLPNALPMMDTPKPSSISCRGLAIGKLPQGAQGVRQLCS